MPNTKENTEAMLHAYERLEKARYAELNEKEHKLSRIGAGTSVRLHIEGKNINGIFTEEKAEKFMGFEGIILRNLQNAKNIPQSDAGKEEYLRGINAVREFENEKLAEIRGIDNGRQAQAPAALALPVLTSGGGSRGML